MGQSFTTKTMKSRNLLKVVSVYGSRIATACQVRSLQMDGIRSRWGGGSNKNTIISCRYLINLGPSKFVVGGNLITSRHKILNVTKYSLGPRICVEFLLRIPYEMLLWSWNQGRQMECSNVSEKWKLRLNFWQKNTKKNIYICKKQTPCR
jgi:hypothetical protein